MPIVEKEFSLDVVPGYDPPVIHVSEYDVGRRYSVSILDDGVPLNLHPNLIATIDGTVENYINHSEKIVKAVFKDISANVEDNKVIFDLTEEMTAHKGRAWCKIKFKAGNESISTCGFILEVDRAGAEAEVVINARGFDKQIIDAVTEYLDEHGGGLTEEIKQALLDCFENVAWINDQGQTYYNALHTALYPPAELVSIAAVYTQSAVVTESTELDALKSDLVVTATYSDATRREISNYTLYGTLTSGESFITVAYGGKTTRFSVTVTGGVLYALPQSESFNGNIGAKSIDTGLQLMATDRSFTIMFSAVTGNGATDESPIFHCLTESPPYPGLSFQRYGSRYTLGGFGSANANVECSSVAGVPFKVVIRHTKGSQYCYVDSNSDGVRNEQVISNNGGTFKASDKNMLIGSYQTATGEKGRFWAGTISEFIVISDVISDAAVDNYLGEGA